MASVAIDKMFDLPADVMFCVVDFAGDIFIDGLVAEVLVNALADEVGEVPEGDPHVFVCFHHDYVRVIRERAEHSVLTGEDVGC